MRAVDGVSFSILAGQVLGIVGESGSGKSVTAMSLMRLIRDPNAITTGEVFYKGRDLLKLSADQMRAVRGSEIAMIFQDPMTSLNPVYRVGWQIAEQVRAHEKMSKAQAHRRAVELLDAVGIPRPDLRVDDYPHQFSGGMRQRAMIAMALSCNPDLLIADEPTTALDVTIQAQILALLRKLQSEFGSAIMLITHDMGVVADIADRVCVMYAGRVVEDGPKRELFSERAAPVHLGPAGLDPAHRPAQAAPPDRDPGPAALAALAARRAARSRRAARMSSRPAPSSRRSRSAPRPVTSTAASCRCRRSSRGARPRFTRSSRRERRAAAHGRGRDEALPGQGRRRHPPRGRARAGRRRRLAGGARRRDARPRRRVRAAASRRSGAASCACTS